jgi:predicted NUDIX family NTP pyrophosphohydrolase
MAKQSAGIVLFRRTEGAVEVLLVHPGGPFWRGKDEHAWSIPKGEFLPDEQPVDAAKRELSEETGIVVQAPLLPLGSVKQSGGKVVHAWAAEQDADVACIRSVTFEMEWPPRSGKRESFPEVDRAAWFSIDVAQNKIVLAQVPFLDRVSALAG